MELASEVYRRFPQEIPHTSTPVMQDFYNVVEELKTEGYENVLGVFISSNLSSTCQTAKMVLDEHPELNSFVLDTKNISIGAGLLAMWAAVQLEQGVSFEEVCQKLPAKVADSKVFFYMDTLEYLRKGGRISNVTAIVGTVLNIKPLLKGDEEGRIVAFGKVRGRKHSVEAIAERYDQLVDHPEEQLVCIAHAACEKDADYLISLLNKNHPPKEILKVCYEPVTGSHVGPGALALFFEGRDGARLAIK